MTTSISRRRLVLALPAAVVLGAACFASDAPTEQVGGTQYGMLLNPVSPVRVPTMQVTTTGSGATLTQIVARLTNFKRLVEPAHYRFYAVGGGAGDTVPVSASISIIRHDSVANAAGGVTVTRTVFQAGNVSGFTGTENNDTLVATFPGAQFGGTSRRFLVVTIQAAATPTYTAATPQPVWYRYRNDAAPNNVITGAGTALFGNFDLIAPRPFSGGGRGRSAFWDRQRTGALDYQAIVEQITQPPRGYYYQGWLRDTRTRRAVALSELVDNDGRSLRDADQLQIPGTVAQIPVGRFGATAQAVGEPLQSFDGVHLVLEPKLGVDSTHGLATVLQGVVGDTLGLRGLGAIEVVVRRGGADVGNARVVVVPVNGVVSVGQPRPATTGTEGEQLGRTLVTGIPAGVVDVVVTAPTGATAAVRSRTTVVRQDTVTVTVTLP